jgi:hypothetical protein
MELDEKVMQEANDWLNDIIDELFLEDIADITLEGSKEKLLNIVYEKEYEIYYNKAEKKLKELEIDFYDSIKEILKEYDFIPKNSVDHINTIMLNAIEKIINKNDFDERLEKIIDEKLDKKLNIK